MLALLVLRLTLFIAMVVGTLKITLAIPGSDSLKDKRQVVRSLLDVARNKFNVSAAEIDHLDTHRLACIAFACVSNNKIIVNRMLNKILDVIESNPLCEVVDSELDIIS